MGMCGKEEETTYIKYLPLTTSIKQRWTCKHRNFGNNAHTFTCSCTKEHSIAPVQDEVIHAIFQPQEVSKMHTTSKTVWDHTEIIFG